MPGIGKSRIGVALGSGAARGWAHIGALRALSDLGITPEVVCGTSIGALVGGFYLTGHLDALEDWACRITRLGMVRYLDVRLAGNGLIAGNRLFAEMERRLRDTTIADLPVPYASVATDLYTGRETWLAEGRLIDAIRASFSLPGFFSPVQVDGRWVVDGALVNPVPVSVCHALGAQVVIAINLNATAPTKNGWPGSSLPNDAIAQSVELDNGPEPRRYGRRIAFRARRFRQRSRAAPSLVGVIASTLNIVQDRVTRSRLAADPPEVHILPKVGRIGLLDFHRAAEAIEAGATAVYHAEAHIRDATAMFEAAAS